MSFDAITDFIRIEIERHPACASALAILLPPLLLFRSVGVMPLLCVLLWCLALAIFLLLWAGVGFLLALLMSWMSGFLMVVSLFASPGSRLRTVLEFGSPTSD